MSEPQGELAEPVADATEPVNEPEVKEAEAVTEEPEEVNYQERSESLQREADGKQGKIDKQRAALSQANAKIQELQQQEAKPVEDVKAPNIDDYETLDKFNEADKDFAIKQALKADRANQTALQQQNAIDTRNKAQADEFALQEAEYKLENPNYTKSKTAVQEHLELSPISGAVGDAIYEVAAKNGGLAKMIDYFGDNNGENLHVLDTISKLSPVEAAVEMYKVSQKVVVAPKKETKPTSKPVKAAKTTTAGSKPLDKRDGRGVLDWVNS